MGVQIDKAGGYEPAGRVDFLAPLGQVLADSGNLEYARGQSDLSVTPPTTHSTTPKSNYMAPMVHLYEEGGVSQGGK